MPTDDLIRDAVAKARKTLCEGDTMTPCCLEDYDAEVIMEVAVREYIDLAAEQLEPGADLEGRAREWMGRECPSYMKDAPELRQAIIKSLAALLRDVAGEERVRMVDLGHAAGVEDAAKVVDALLVSVAKVTPTSDLTSGLHAAVIEIVTDCAAAIRGLKGGGDGE